MVKRRKQWLRSDMVTVSYTRSDGLAATTVGHGRTIGARIADADRQLPPGEWTRDVVSTPTSILSDLRGRPLEGSGSRPCAYPLFEGKRLTV